LEARQVRLLRTCLKRALPLTQNFLLPDAATDARTDTNFIKAVSIPGTEFTNEAYVPSRFEHPICVSENLC
jgi:hypothetical protein